MNNHIDLDQYMSMIQQQWDQQYDASQQEPEEPGPQIRIGPKVVDCSQMDTKDIEQVLKDGVGGIRVGQFEIRITQQKDYEDIAFRFALYQQIDHVSRHVNVRLDDRFSQQRWVEYFKPPNKLIPIQVAVEIVEYLQYVVGMALFV